MGLKKLQAVIWIVLCLSATKAHAQKVDRPSPFLPTGSMLRVTLTNAIYSYNLATPVVAELDGAAKFKDIEALPDKTRLLGKAQVLKSHDRVNIDFDLAVLPDGREIEILGLALSPDGSAGVQGTVTKHKDSLVASAALKGAVMGVARVAGATINPIAAEAGQAVAQETVNAIDLSREQIDTAISIPAFTRCLFYLEKRLEMMDPKKEVKLDGGKQH